MSRTKSDEPTTVDHVRNLAPWFHNLHLPDGTQTEPAHPLGDFPANKWARIVTHIPDDLTGWSALDVGCNAGFYSFELARRGAAVTAIDCDPHYLRQAQWAAEEFGLTGRIRFRQQQIYDLAHTPERFDIVWFMGVFYHLRYPVLGLDIVARKTRRLLVFQTMTSPGDKAVTPPPNLALTEREQMNQSGWPKMAFIEHRLENDPTNWWAANHACVEALLRSCGFDVLARPAHEIYLCAPHPTAEIPQFLHDEYLAATGQSTQES